MFEQYQIAMAAVGILNLVFCVGFLLGHWRSRPEHETIIDNYNRALKRVIRKAAKNAANRRLARRVR